MSKKELFRHYLVKNFLKEYMKYTTKEAIKEIRRRAKIIRQKRDRKTTNILASSATVSFIFSAKAGGYMLVAFLGFIAGVSVTLMAKYKLTIVENKDEYTLFCNNYK